MSHPHPSTHREPSGAAAKQSDREMVEAHLDRLRESVVKPAEGSIKYPYCIPGGFYQQQWDWDGFFISLHFAGRKPSQPEYLKYWTLNVLECELPDGDVSSCITPQGPRLAHPSLRLKPFLAQGAELAARLLGDYHWLEARYHDIVRLATRREKTHFNHEFCLFAWEDAMQSGADNNPAVGNSPSTRGTRAGCDINTFFHREYLALARIAKALNKDSDQKRFESMAASLKTAINTHLWDSQSQSYWTLDLQKKTWLTRVSYSNFVPLWTGLASQGDGAAMLEHYLWNEDHLLSPFGLRTLSRTDPDYNNELMVVPYSNWQGPIWPIANYFYFVGLMNYGFQAQASDLIDRLTGLYLRDLDFCDSLHENYDAESGRPLSPSADQSKDGWEGGFVGWNLLLQDMIEMAGGRSNLVKL